MSNNQNQTSDRVSSNLPSYVADPNLKAFFDDQMGHDGFRNKVKEIITEAADSVPFMEKIKKYASQEIDTRVFKSGLFFFGILVVPCIVSVVGGILVAIVLKALGIR